MIQNNIELQNKLANSNIIWAHSGIGKTYLYRQGRNDIIDFDFEYKGVIGDYLAFPDLLLDSNISEDEANRIRHSSKIMVDRLFDLAIEEAKTTNKKLLVSDVRLLQERFKDFDIIISIPKDTYLNNTINRKELSRNSRLIIKEKIDKVLENISDKHKVFEITCYLSDVLPMLEEYNFLSKKERHSKLINRFKYLSKELSELNY